jgi:mRNA interferase MazF
MKPATRGEVWLANLNPTRGREQSGRRPVIVVSHDAFNRGPADLVIVCPITSRLRGIASHVGLVPPDGGLRTQSVVMCEAVRSISKQRLHKVWGMAREDTMLAIDDVLRILLCL